MSPNRLFVLVIAVALAVVAAFVIREGMVTKAIAPATDRLDDYALRHPNLSIPVTGPKLDIAGSDYYERHRAESMAVSAVDTTDYAARHPGLNLPLARRADLTDYYYRHPELSIP